MHKETEHRTAEGLPSSIAMGGDAIILSALFATTLVLATPVSARTVSPLTCLPESAGPVASDPAPYPGGMCGLGTFDGDTGASYHPREMSADGLIIGGYATTDEGDRAFVWSTKTGMIDLGTLRPDNSGRSKVKAMSADGSIAAGYAQSMNGIHAFRWSEDTGMTDLGTLRPDNSGTSKAQAMSADGLIIAGNAAWEDTEHAFRWSEDTGMVDLGTLRPGNAGSSRAHDVNADGSVVVGYARSPDGGHHAFRWSEDTGMVDLGTFITDAPSTSDARGVSADGSVVVGLSQITEAADTHDLRFRAFRWTEDGGLLDLGTLRDDRLGESHSDTISADGRVIVGYADTDSGATHAFRWSEETGMVDLGTMRDDDAGDSLAYATSADGSVIVGMAHTEDGWDHAFRWSEETGMVDLGTMRGLGSGYSYASAVSADGSIITGQARTDDGIVRGFIWRGTMQDIDNLLLSFPALATDTAIAANRQEDAVRFLSGRTCIAEAGRSCLMSTFSVDSASMAATGSGTGASAGGALSYGFGLSDRLTIGVSVGLFAGDPHGKAFDADRLTAGTIWGRYSEGGLVATGWQGEIAIAHGRASGDITRGRGLDGVLLASGVASMKTRAIRARLGYGFAPSRAWRVTPGVGIGHYRTTRGAYEESGNDFNASFDRLTLKRTTVDVSLEVDRIIGARDRISLAAGMEHDLGADHPVLTGKSDLPGATSLAVSARKSRRNRAFVSMGYEHGFGNGATLSGRLDLAQPAYGGRPVARLGVGYGIRF